ncbi:MAG: hypothetical protein CSB32_01550 [Desulfobacterales bacterium]|nr:MAG: hypothetical protein CSB32_01550 [Desulfobacterales bacterium]
MSQLSPEFYLWAQYAAPPLLGAFIGYLTNRIAIRMLFRPLRPWRIFGLRVPMTPGVIPAKRVQLAENMGEVVGDHLLTSEEIGKGLRQDAFQQQLFHLLQGRVQELLARDFGTIRSALPEKFHIYLNLGVIGLSWQVKNQIAAFIRSPQFDAVAKQSVEHYFDELAEREIGELLPLKVRDSGYLFIEENLEKMFSDKWAAQWLDDFLHQKFYAAMRENRPLGEILPAPLPSLLEEIVVAQVPSFLAGAGVILRDKETVDRLVAGFCAGIDSFIDSLGAASDMVRGFLDMDLVEQKIREYLGEKEEDIVCWLQADEINGKIETLVGQCCHSLLQKPLAEILVCEDEEKMEALYQVLRAQILRFFRQEKVSALLVSVVKTNIESQIDSGALSVGEAAKKLFGGGIKRNSQQKVLRELQKIIQSEETGQAISQLVDSLVASLLNKKIGRLQKIVPAGVVDGVAESLQTVVSKMLESEVPGLVQSLGIRKIVTEKINSLDLLRLEKLLLSIMEEQFKYINLFGALLGFMIGCCNLVFLLVG